MIKVLKELNGGRQIVIEEDGKTFLVSQSRPDFQPVETLVFPCDIEGKVSSYVEVGGEIGIGIDAFMKRVLEEGKIPAPWKDELPF